MIKAAKVNQVIPKEKWMQKVFKKLFQCINYTGKLDFRMQCIMKYETRLKTQ